MLKPIVLVSAVALSCGGALAQPAQYSCPPSLEGHQLINWTMQDASGGQLLSGGSQSSPVWKLTAAQATSGSARIVCGYLGIPKTVVLPVRPGLRRCVNEEMTSRFDCTSAEAPAVAAAVASNAPGRKATYKGQGMTFRMLDRGDGTADVSGETTGGGGCMGSFSGSGRVDGNRISVPVREAPACRIDIVRTAKGISTTETDACGSLHGARCNFAGTATQAR